MILAKWKSFMCHVSNNHTDHPDSNFEKCAHHENIEPKKWIKVGMSIWHLEKYIVSVGLVASYTTQTDIDCAFLLP